METFNIIVKCKTEEERDIVLATLDEGVANSQVETLIEQGIVSYQRHDANVYFSENEEQHFMEKKRVII
jgi:hypothetical protein